MSTVTDHYVGPFRTFFDLKEEQRTREWFAGDFRRLEGIMQLLDSAKRHDAILPSEVRREVSRSGLSPYPQAFDTAITHIEQASRNLDQALEAINCVFKGELKATLEDRLERLLRLTAASDGAFKAQYEAHRTPDTAYKARQQLLAGMVLEIGPIIVDIARVRSNAGEQEDVGEEVMSRLQQAESRARQLRAQLQKARDNPSQRMGRRSTEWKLEYYAVLDLLLSVKCKLRWEYMRAGHKFTGRGGGVTGQWQDEYQHLDPWTFDPDGSELLLWGGRG